MLPETSEVPQEVPQESPEEVPQEVPEVLGVQAFGNGGAEIQQQETQQRELPTAVNAGAPGAARPAGVSLIDSFLGMLLVLLGAVTARLGWIRARG